MRMERFWAHEYDNVWFDIRTLFDQIITVAADAHPTLSIVPNPLEVSDQAPIELLFETILYWDSERLHAEHKVPTLSMTAAKL